MENNYNNNEFQQSAEQNNNKGSKKNNKIVIVILVLIILGLASYVLYDKILSNKNADNNINNSGLNEDSNNTKTDSQVDTTNVEPEPIKLSNNDNTVIDLANMIESDINTKKGQLYENGYFFQYKNITLSNLSDFEKFAISFTYLNPEHVDLTSCSDFNKLTKYNNINNLYSSCVNSKSNIADYADSLLNGAYTGLFNLNFKDLQKDYQKIFGNDVLLSENFSSTNLGYVCKYNSNSQNMLCTLGTGGGNTPERAFVETDYALKYSNYIELYDYYINIDFSDNSMSYDKDFKNVANNKYTGQYDYSQNLKLDELKKIGQLYKHTFKQNSDGSYYWYSSEPVK